MLPLPKPQRKSRRDAKGSNPLPGSSKRLKVSQMRHHPKALPLDTLPNITHQCDHLITNGTLQELITFLKGLSTHERKGLVPTVRAILGREFAWHGSDPTREKRQSRAYVAAFVCLGLNDVASHTFRDEIIDYDILSWYCPSWFSDYFDTFYAEENYSRMDYYKILYFMEKGDLDPAPALIATELAHTKPPVDTMPAITLKEHIWYLFRYECGVQSKNIKIQAHAFWMQAFKTLTEAGTIDRLRVLEEAFLTVSRNLNRAVTGFYFDLIATLEPADDELIRLQEAMLTVFAARHSKPINQVLTYIKRIYRDTRFDVTGFMAYLPQLLTTDIKSTVSATLHLIDALAKVCPESKPALMQYAVQTFSQSEPSLQMKTISLLKKHKMLETKHIMAEIEAGYDGLTMEVKEALDLPPIALEDMTVSPTARIREDNRLPDYETFEDLLFFLSRHVDNPDPLDFELFAAWLPKLGVMLTGQNVGKLKPLLMRAYTLYTNKPGNTVFAMLSLLLWFAKHLSERYAEVSDVVRKHEKYLAETRFEYRLPIDFENLPATPSISYLFQKRLQYTMEQIKRSDATMPVCTPTHAPCWIEAQTLIDRIQAFADIEAIPLYDFQIALNRVVIDEHRADMTALSGESAAIFHYFFSGEPLKLSHIKHPGYWVSAILRRRREEDGALFAQAFIRDDARLNILNPPRWLLTREISAYSNRIRFDERHFDIFVNPKKLMVQKKRTLLKIPFDSLYKHLDMGRFGAYPPLEECRALILTPAAPEHILSTLIDRNFKDGDGRIDTAVIVRNTFDTLTLLGEIWSDNDSEITYLYLSFTLLVQDKTLRTLAAELWIKAVSEGTMNAELLGQTLGRLEHGDYAPLKRFTDLIDAHMLNITSLHNRALEAVLAHHRHA